MWGNQILLAIIGLSAGTAVAGGLFALIVELGVIADFADRTHTADCILLYEDSTALGGIVGTIFLLFHIPIPGGRWIVPIFGLLAGIFVGCWSMALAEIINVFPIFIRRVKMIRYIAAFVISMAIGRGFGALTFFFLRW